VTVNVIVEVEHNTDQEDRFQIVTEAQVVLVAADEQGNRRPSAAARNDRRHDP